MKADDRWKRYDMVTGFLEPEIEDYLQRLENLHVEHCGPNAKYIAGDELTFAG